MTTVSGAGSTLTQQLYQKLFDRLNVDGDEAVNLSEMAATGVISTEVSRIFKALDADGDGRVVRSEMTPSDTFGVETLSALIATQVGPKALTDQEYLADWFARADTNGDGLLNRDERKADADLRRAAVYDAGYIPGRVLLVRSDADEVRMEDIGVGRVITPSADAVRMGAISHVAPAHWAAASDSSGRTPPKPEVLTQEESDARLEQLRADLAERASGPEGSYRLLSRELDGLRADQSARIAVSPISDALAARLFSQILGGWKGEATA